MADAGRWFGGRYHPAFLTCLMLVISIVMVVQYTYCSSSGPAYLITLPAHSVFTKLDLFGPSTNRAQIFFQKSSSQIQNVSTTPTDIFNIRDIGDARAAMEEKPSHVPLGKLEISDVEDISGALTYPSSKEERPSHVPLGELEISDVEDISGALTYPSSPETLGNVSVGQTVSGVVAETVRAVVPDSKNAGRDPGESVGLDISVGEFDGEEFAHSVVSLDSARVESANGEANQVDIKAVEKESGILQLGRSEVQQSTVEGTFRSTIESPNHVQTKDLESQDDKEQSMGTPETSEISRIPKVRKPSTIFHELQACKLAIKEVSSDSADPSLHGPLYKNVDAFSKSYELMEKVFKVYVYKDGRKPLVHAGPMEGIYASEGQFIERMKRARGYRTDEPSEAHMFFLPYSVQHMVAHLYVPNSRTMLPLATFIKNYVESLAQRHPFWNRTQGADHFFVSCHDWGPATTRDHPTLRSNAMKVVCNADTTEEFVMGKDASLPEVIIHRLRSKSPAEKLGGPRYDQRPYLAFFAGQMHGRVRPILLSFWKDKDPDMKIYEVLPKQIARVVSYIQHMKMSKYCICAMGYEVNSPRIVEAIYNDCVPVIIADNFVLPFSDVLDWETFSVTIPERDIHRLKSLLTAIPDKTYIAMQRRLHKVRLHFVWHDTPKKYDAFHMILHSVWTSRLNRLEQIEESASGELS